MAANRDPLTDERRNNFRAYCRSEKLVEADGTWAIAAIAKKFGKRPNQIGNILNGHGSFGPTVARGMAAAAGLPEDAFEPGDKKLTPDAYEIARMFDLIPLENREVREKAMVDVVRCLLKYVNTPVANG